MSEHSLSGARLAPAALQLPAGYAARFVGGTLVVAREDLLDVASQLVERHGTLHAWAAAVPGAKPMKGRGTTWAADAPAAPAGGNERPAPGPGDGDGAPAGRAEEAASCVPGAVPPAPRRWVVRHYRRGGAVARWLRDRYLRLGALRPLRELRASAAARERGIRTPEVLALAVYPARAFYRADLATAEVPDAMDLAETLWAEHALADDSPAREAALAAAATLLRELGDAGVAHPDLNAKNILLTGSPSAREAHVLDLDGCRVGAPLDAGRRAALRARLERSLRKWERRTGRPLTAAEWALFAGKAAGP